MEFPSWVFTLFSSISLCFLLLPIQGGLQTHERNSHSLPLSQISLPPSPSPEASAPSHDPTPVFSVLSFGAVGDGVTDDTQAFKLAWDTACQSESATLLVPDSYSFMVQSTIFTGPCKSSLVFQVLKRFFVILGLTLANEKNNTVTKFVWFVFFVMG